MLPCTFRGMRICAAVALAAALFQNSVPFPPPGFAAQEASRGQRVRARTASGEMLDLYDESHALVVGVSDYNNGWRRLPGVKSDVPAVSAVLKQQGFTVTTLLDPAVENFERAMRSFISTHGLKERNRLVIYFAGHGHTERLSDDRDLGYIVMRNAPKPDLDPAGFADSTISMDQMNAYATRIKSKHALFVFDSCFSGSIFRSETKRRPARIESKSANPVRQFITSGNAGQEVQDDSVFRRYFVRALEGEGDLDGDGYVTGEELGVFLSGRVASDTHETQTPLFGKIRDARLNIGDLIFVLPSNDSPAPAPAPAPLPIFDSLAAEIAFWTSIVSSVNIKNFDAYLEQYPNGKFVRLAHNRREELLADEAERRERIPTIRPVLPFAPTAFTTATLANGKLVKYQASCDLFVEDLGGGVKIEMVRVPSGRFTIGSPMGEEGRSNDEGPQRVVRVGEFLMGRYEVTQRQWRAVAALPKIEIELNAAPSRFKGDDLPIEQVSWLEAKEFIARLNWKLGLNRTNGYRLPSEAEWEYAARAGTTTPFAFGSMISPDVVNFDGSIPYAGETKGFSRGKTVSVGSLGLANGWGLFDMQGNVAEWCEDNWRSNYDNVPADGGAWIEAPSRISIDAPMPSLDSEEQIMLKLINDYRARNGVAKLGVSTALTRAGDWMGTDMVTKNYFGHNDSLGRDPFVRMTALGYNYLTTKGENLAAGYADAARTFNQWKNSPSHNSAMLDSRFKVFGVSRVYGVASQYKWYWTTDFGGAEDALIDGTSGSPEQVGRVYRGGDWSSSNLRCRSANRDFGTHADGNSRLGFRLTRTYRQL